MSNLLPGIDIFWQILNIIISLGVLTLLFAMIYKVLPDAKVAWQDVWTGAFVTAILFLVGKVALGIYIGNGSVGSRAVLNFP